MKKIVLLLFLLFPAANIFSQTENWQRLKTDNGEFSIEMPADCYTRFYNKDGIRIFEPNSSNEYQLREMHLIKCYAEQTLLSVEIYQTDAAKKVAKILQEKAEMSGKKMALGTGFNGVEQTDRNQNNVLRRQIIASKNHVYVILAAKRGEVNDAMNNFFASLRLSEENSPSAANDKAILISTLKSIQPEIKIVEMKKDNQDEKKTATDKKQSVAESELKPLIILSKPNPSYTEAARAKNVKGRIIMRLVFGANARISQINVLQSLPEGLLREALMAAVRMHFLPPERNNEPYFVVKTVEYNFNMY